MAAVCPVCGMEVDEITTLKYKGKDYRFCSIHCLEAFQDNPEKYAAAKKK